MGYRFAADATVALHAAFIVFVACGGLLACRWRRVAWLHVPAAAWGAFVEATGGRCPLTPLEVHFRLAAGVAGYDGGFIERYLAPVLYPAGLTRSSQLVLAAAVIAVNAAIYAAILRRARRQQP